MLQLIELPSYIQETVVSYLNLAEFWTVVQTCVSLASLSTHPQLLRVVFKNSKLIYHQNAREILFSVARNQVLDDKCIEYLKDKGVLNDASPDAIADFLFQNRDLEFRGVGVLLGERAGAPILEKFMQHFDFRKMSVCDAFRDFSSNFVLPGEASYLDRILQAFAKVYQQQNPGNFWNCDVVYAMIFSAILLNTDMYSDNVKTKMSKSTFISNMKHAGVLEDYAEEVFDYVAYSPFYIWAQKDSKYTSAAQLSVDGKTCAVHLVLEGLKLSVYNFTKDKEPIFELILLEYRLLFTSDSKQSYSQTTFSLTPKKFKDNIGEKSFIWKLFYRDMSNKTLTFCIPNPTLLTFIEKNLSKHLASIFYKNPFRHVKRQ